MIDYKLINLSILTSALLLVMVLIVGMMRQVGTRKQRMLLGSMFLHFIGVSGAILAYLSNQQPGPVAKFCLSLGVMLAYVFGVFTCVTLIDYVYASVTDMPVENLRHSPIIRLTWAINAFNLAMILSCPVTHAYFHITRENALVYDPLIWLYHSLVLVQGFIIITVTIRIHRFTDNAMSARLVMSGFLALCAAIVNYAMPRLLFEYVALSLVFTMLCVGVQDRLEKELERVRADAAESRVRLLSGQIHPHFVFNSLAAIQALVAEDPALAETAIQDFSDYLRSHLDVMSDARLVPFESELGHVRHYVALELADCVNPLEVRYDFATTDFLVPPLTVQPLVENAIRHGIRTRESGGVVEVSTNDLGDRIEVVVRDNGHGFSSATVRQDQRMRVGIENVRERIERQCGGSLAVRSDAMGTTAVLSIPKEEDHEVSHS